MDTKKKTFHCKTTTEQELTGKKILQNCRNQLYLDFPYLDGAFTSLEYKADSSIDTIGTDGELIYFNPVFLMKKYLEDPAAVRRGYLHMLLHCLYLHIFMEPDRDSGEWDRECDCFVEQLIDKAVGEGKISLKKRKSDDIQVNTNTFERPTMATIGLLIYVSSVCCRFQHDNSSQIATFPMARPV